MLRESKDKVIVNELAQMIDRMATFAENVFYNKKLIIVKTSSTPMLSRTHGQTASPTTVGKEIANFTYRINN